MPNSTTRTPATDMLYNITNGRAHNNSTTCCTTNSPPTDKNLTHRNARAQHLDMSRCWDVANFCPLVVNLLYNKLGTRPLVVLYNMSVAGVRVVEFGTYCDLAGDLVSDLVLSRKKPLSYVYNSIWRLMISPQQTSTSMSLRFFNHESS